MLSHPCSFRIENMTTTGPTLNECPKISKTFTAFLKSLLALMPNQSARDTSTNDLASANFEKSLDLLNKLDEKAFQRHRMTRNFLRWCQLITQRE